MSHEIRYVETTESERLLVSVIGAGGPERGLAFIEEHGRDLVRVAELLATAREGCTSKAGAFRSVWQHDVRDLDEAG